MDYRHLVDNVPEYGRENLKETDEIYILGIESVLFKEYVEIIDGYKEEEE